MQTIQTQNQPNETNHKDIWNLLSGKSANFCPQMSLITRSQIEEINNQVWTRLWPSVTWLFYDIHVTTAFVYPLTSDVTVEPTGQKMFQTFFLHFLHHWRSDILATISISKSQFSVLLLVRKLEALLHSPCHRSIYTLGLLQAINTSRAMLLSKLIK